MDETRRFVIRRTSDGLYYNGNQTFNYNNFDGFEKAKVFKNIAGAKKRLFESRPTSKMVCGKQKTKTDRR